MKRQGKDVLYFETGPDNPPTLRVAPGEEFEVETQVNAGLWPDDDPRSKELRSRVRGGNPSSGAIHVEGAEPGGVLAVHVGAFDLDPLGYTAFSGSTGAMPGWLGGSGVGAHHKQVEIRDGLVIWSDRIELPVRPMLGFVATAPRRERWHNGWGAGHGGNFDVQEITTGATVYLPIEVPGALLHVGDMHAIQGDGEICGAGGIEASGRVRLSCDVLPRPASWRGPRIEDATHIEWAAYPDMLTNPNFVAELERAVDKEALVMFICRSGVRSHNAAVAATRAGFSNCYNVLEGFEGDADAEGHRNTLTGWRACGLPWEQN